MSCSIFRESLLNQERGIRWSFPFIQPSLPLHNQPRVIQNTISSPTNGTIRRAPPVYMRGKEDYLVYLNLDGQVVLTFLQDSPRASLLTDPQEKALKFLLREDCLYLVIMHPVETHLRFYKVLPSDLRKGIFYRERIMTQTTFTPSSLRQVDSKYSKLIFQDSSHFSVWDLDSESQVFECLDSFNASVWYSRNSVIQTSSTTDGTVFNITRLSGGQKYSIKLLGLFEFFQIEVIDNLLVVGSNHVHVFDFEARENYGIRNVPPKFYLETEQLSDAFIVFGDGTGRFVSSPEREVRLNCFRPLFTDCMDLLIVYDSGKISFIDPVFGTCTETQVDVCRTVSCVGVNEDTLEVYLGCDNGLILILE